MHTHSLSVLVACVVLQERVIFSQRGRVLLLRQENICFLPSFTLCAGELPCDVALQRSRERFGVTLSLDNLEQPTFTLFQPASPKAQGHVYFFFAELVQNAGSVTDREFPSGGQLEWHLPEKLPEETTPLARFALECLERRLAFAVVPDILLV